MNECRYCIVSREGIDFLIPYAKYGSWIDWLNKVDDSNRIPKWALRVEEKES